MDSKTILDLDIRKTIEFDSDPLYPERTISVEVVTMTPREHPHRRTVIGTGRLNPGETLCITSRDDVETPDDVITNTPDRPNKNIDFLADIFALGKTEREIIEMQVKRLKSGATQYGEWDPNDGRDYEQETLEELVDATQYLCAEMIRRRDTK